MTDEELRRLERRWRKTNALEDETRYLLERVRVGALTRERLELAAYCGHSGARRATAQTVGSGLDLLPWLLELQRRDPQAALRAAVTIGRLVLPVWESVFPLDPRPATALAAADAVLRSESDSMERVGAAADEANDAFAETGRTAPRASFAAGCASAVADFAGGAVGEVVSVVETARQAGGESWSDERVLASLQAELARWALGHVRG